VFGSSPSASLRASAAVCLGVVSRLAADNTGLIAALVKSGHLQRVLAGTGADPLRVAVVRLVAAVGAVKRVGPLGPAIATLVEDLVSPGRLAASPPELQRALIACCPALARFIAPDVASRLLGGALSFAWSCENPQLRRSAWEMAADVLSSLCGGGEGRGVSLWTEAVRAWSTIPLDDHDLRSLADAALAAGGAAKRGTTLGLDSPDHRRLVTLRATAAPDSLKLSVRWAMGLQSTPPHAAAVVLVAVRSVPTLHVREWCGQALDILSVSGPAAAPSAAATLAVAAAAAKRPEALPLLASALEGADEAQVLALCVATSTPTLLADRTMAPHAPALLSKLLQHHTSVAPSFLGLAFGADGTDPQSTPALAAAVAQKMAR